MLKSKNVTFVSICFAITVIGCSPTSPKRNLNLNTDKLNLSKPSVEKPNTTSTPEEAIVYELTPTYVPYTKKLVNEKVENKPANEIKKQTAEIIYEKPVKKVKNKQAIINLDSLNMSKVLMRYDQAKRKLSIQGHAQILDEDKKPIADTDFVIAGQHTVVDASFSLKADDSVKLNSREKPVVGAKVTCLTYDENDQTACSSVIIDFLIAYKKQIYSEQMEVKRELQKIAPPPVPTPVAVPVPKPEPIKIKEAAELPQLEVLQQEGEEDSLLGRYQGQTETADLTEVFEKDDEIQSVLKLEEPKKEEKLPGGVQQTKSGDLRPTNQAIGMPNSGSLRNATSLVVKQSILKTNSFFEIVYPDRKRFFATYEMAEMITRLGSRLNAQMEKKLAVSDIAKLKGGLLSSHLSHQTGLDADLGYPTEDKVKFPTVVRMSNRNYDRSAYSVEKTYDLLKFAFKQPDIKIARVFVDRIIKQALCQYAKSAKEFQSADKAVVENMFRNIDHVSGHGDHFHLRLKCSSSDPACRNREYKENNGCGAI